MTFLASRPICHRKHRNDVIVKSYIKIWQILKLKSKDITSKTLHVKFYASRLKNKQIRRGGNMPPGSGVSPCIMCVQYHGGCSVPWGISWVPWGISWVPWGCSVPWGDIMINMGDILSTMGVFSTVGDIMSTVGVILSTVRDVQYCGGISWCTWGMSWVPWRVFSTVGGKSIVIWVPHGTEHPHGTHDIPPHASWYPPTVLKFQKQFWILNLFWEFTWYFSYQILNALWLKGGKLREDLQIHFVMRKGPWS